MIIAIAPYIIMVRSYMESEPIVAMSNEKPIKITTAIAPYAGCRIPQPHRRLRR